MEAMALPTAEGFDIAYAHGRARMDMIKRQERIIASTSQFSEEGRRARAEFDAMFDALMSVAKTPQSHPAESKAVAGEDLTEKR